MSDIEIPPRPTIKKLQAVAAGCTACHLWKNATQTVFGEGKQTSTVMFVGEQPGDKEDLSGHPFVGPAGALLDKALAEAGIDRRTVYVTNVVKHFKWEPRGKRRIHKKPNAAEITACRPWLEAEVAVDQAARDHLPRIDRRAGSDRTEVPRVDSARAVRRVGSRAVRHRDRPSVVDPARADGRRAARGDAAVHDDLKKIWKALSG